MKSIKPVYFRSSNNNEKIAGLVCLFVMAFILLFAGMVSAKPADSNSVAQTFAGEGLKNDSTATVRWIIEGDSSYPFFLVERSQDKIHYQIVSIIKSKNYKAPELYNVVDYNPLKGHTYYRISETDLKSAPLHLFEIDYPVEANNLTQK